MRKQTYGYVDFVRGKYSTENKSYISWLFQQMTQEEINKIVSQSFDVLWDDVCNNQPNGFRNMNNYDRSKSRYTCIKNDPLYSLNDIIQSITNSPTSPEWGFPKGRRSGNETDIDCAKREFLEETGVSDDNYILFPNIAPLIENLTGTNGIRYRNVYYIALMNPQHDGIFNHTSNMEVGAIAQLILDDAINKVDHSHQQILYNLFYFIVTCIIENTNSENNSSV
jgi:8-oxo-dGTP pyrophosphatase MutT (NUDIX family)